MAQRFARDESIRLDAKTLKARLSAELNVLVPDVRVCHAWLSRHWYVYPATRIDVEDACGQRFRPAAHRQDFADEAAAELLSRSLAEEQPPVHITGILLLEWYARYHPDARPLRAYTLEELEHCLGPELRGPPYAGLQAVCLA